MTVLPVSVPVIVTATGTMLSVVVPLPNWPTPLLPHAATVPSEQRARVC